MAKIPVPRFTLKDVNAKTRSLVYLIYRYRGLKLIDWLAARKVQLAYG